MAISVTNNKVRKLIRVLRVEYKYEDLELGQDVVDVRYVNSVDNLPEYFQDILQDNVIMDVFNHPNCRMNPQFKIKTVALTERMYNKLFKINSYDSKVRS